jgi:hypothetical protein
VAADASSSPAPAARGEGQIHGRISEATLQNLQLLNQLALQLQCQVQHHSPPRSMSPASCGSPAAAGTWAQASQGYVTSHCIAHDAVRAGHPLHADQREGLHSTNQLGAVMHASCTPASQAHPDHAAALMASWAAEEFQFPELSSADSHTAVRSCSVQGPSDVPGGVPAGGAEASTAAADTCTESASWEEGAPKQQQPHTVAVHQAEGIASAPPEGRQPEVFRDACSTQTDSCTLSSSEARSHAAFAAAHAAAAAKAAAMAAAQAASAATAAAAAAAGEDSLQAAQAGSRGSCVVPVMQLDVMGHMHAGAPPRHPQSGTKQAEDKSLRDNNAHGSSAGTHDFRITAVYSKGDADDCLSPDGQYRCVINRACLDVCVKQIAKHVVRSLSSASHVTMAQEHGNQLFANAGRHSSSITSDMNEKLLGEVLPIKHILVAT